MLIVFVRHGESEICIDPEELKRQGHTSDRAQLTQPGREQMRIAADELAIQLQGKKQIVILSGPNDRTIESAAILAEALGCHKEGVRVEEFLAEVGQGPIGELTKEAVASLPPGLQQKQASARDALKNPTLDLYNFGFPLDEEQTPKAIEERIRGPLLAYLEGERVSGTEVVVIAGNAGSMRIVQKILAGHGIERFNTHFAQPNRPARAAIEVLELPEGTTALAGAFRDLGTVFHGDQLGPMPRTPKGLKK